MNRFLYSIFFMTLLSLFSCSKNKTLKTFTLDIEFTEPIANLKVDEPLPEYLQILVNYIDTSTLNELLVPKIKFRRLDLPENNEMEFEPPLTWLNKFRLGRGMLPSEFLKEDYDKLLPKLKTPKLLVEPKGKVQVKDAFADTRRNLLFLNIREANDDSISALHERFVKKLIESKGNSTFYIRIINVPKQRIENESTEHITKDSSESNTSKPVKNSITPVKPKVAVKPPSSNTKQGPSGNSGKNDGKVITITLPNGDIYKGEVKNNLPDGLGTLTFKKARQISMVDPIKTKAEINDYFTGNWVKGEPQSGKLYSSDGKWKKTIIIGGEN